MSNSFSNPPKMENTVMNGNVDIKDLLQLDLSLHEEIIPPLMNGTFGTDMDGEDEEEDELFSTNITRAVERVENKEKTMLEFLRGLMTHEQAAKNDMIKTLTDQVSILKQELTHKQTIIDALLGNYNRFCSHNNGMTHHINNPHNCSAALAHQHTVSETLLDVKTLIEEQITRNEARVESGVPHKVCRIRLKPQKPVSQILSEIKDLMEAHISPSSNDNRSFNASEKVYRVRFNIDGHAFVSLR